MKRGKIVILLSTCFLSIGLLIFAVYSILQVGFSFGGKLSFNPEGVFVKIEGNVLRGKDYFNLSELLGNEYTFNGQNFDDSTGLTSGNFPIADWEPEVAFLPSQKFIQYQIKITNYSDEAISAIPSGLELITDVEAWESVSEVLKIDPLQTGIYELNLEYTGTEETLNTTFNIDFDIQTISALSSSQTGITFEQKDGRITSITGSNTSNPNLLVVPSEINNVPITALGNDNSHSSIVSNITAKYVILEGDISKIGGSAFRLCSVITDINLLGVKEVQNGAFYGCSSLRSINMPDVENIGAQALDSCSVLGKLCLPSKNFSILGGVFYGCTKIMNTVGNIQYISAVIDGKRNNFYAINDVISTDTTNEEINEACKLILPSSFTGCNKLSSIFIPENVISIHSTTFDNCDNLKIYVDSNNRYFSSYEGSLYNKTRTELIRAAGGLSNIEIPEGVLKIGDRAFYYNPTIKSVNMESVTNIGFTSFSRCTALTSINMPNIVSIGRRAFADCTLLNNITIPSSCKSIESSAFTGCNNLTNAVIADPNGWWYASSSTATSGTSLDATNLSNTSTAASYLKSTYCNYYWKKS